MSTKTADKKTDKKPTDLTTLKVVNVSFNRPAKWYMYVAKQALKANETIDIRARPLGAAQVVRVSEALKRLGYIEYVKYQTSTEIVEKDRLRRYITVTVKKTANFEKLYNQREEERKKFLESQGKKE